MIRSMTGYGAGEAADDTGKATIEVRSLNHRFLDLNLRLPKTLLTLEPKLAELVRGRVARGRINLTLVYERQANTELELSIDEDLAGNYLEAVEKLREKFRLSGQITLTDLTLFPDVVKRQAKPVDPESLWSLVESAAGEALDDLDDMKEREGKALDGDLRGLIAEIGKELDRVDERAPERIKEYRERLRKAVEDAAEGHEIDQGRLEQEVTYLADRLDISEEIARLRSHLQQFLTSLERTGPVGRRLDFLLQEMLREANTITSKAGDSIITYHGLTVKEAAESLKEQVQNIE